jgi:uncharacterized protein
MCAALRVTLTGATGLIGAPLVAALRGRDAQVTVLTRAPERARARLGDVEAVGWESIGAAAPAEALAGRDAVVHLAGEPVAQRWSARAKRAIHDSRVIGTRNLLDGLARAQPPPPVLISASAIGYYGARGEEPLDEDASPGEDFLAQVCVEWESAAAAASELDMRVAQVRTGVVLDATGGALAKMLPAFKLGLGGPIAGGRQYVSWIHLHDVLGMILTALEDERWSGPCNATAPEPVTSREFSRRLGSVLGRPAALPLPGLALRALYGEMAGILTGGARVLPAKALVLGYEFAHPELDSALRAALS